MRLTQRDCLKPHKILQEECHHSYDKQCHTTYTTEYESQQEEECDDNYKKECAITYRFRVTEMFRQNMRLLMINDELILLHNT